MVYNKVASIYSLQAYFLAHNTYVKWGVHCSSVILQCDCSLLNTKDLHKTKCTIYTLRRILLDHFIGTVLWLKLGKILSHYPSSCPL